MTILVRSWQRQKWILNRLLPRGRRRWIQHLRIGHDIREHKEIHAELDFVDRVMFQWSAGGFFHPAVVKDTKKVIDDYRLADHTEWKSFGSLLTLSRSLLFLLSQIIVGLAKGTNIAGATVNIYKNNGSS